jgi:hypothetical protein
MTGSAATFTQHLSFCLTKWDICVVLITDNMGFNINNELLNSMSFFRFFHRLFLNNS